MRRFLIARGVRRRIHGRPALPGAGPIRLRAEPLPHEDSLAGTLEVARRRWTGRRSVENMELDEDHLVERNPGDLFITIHVTPDQDTEICLEADSRALALVVPACIAALAAIAVWVL